MIEFNTPANTTEALAIINAMQAGFTAENPGGDAFKSAEVMALIGDSFLFYNKAYCAQAQQRDGLFKGYNFNGSTPFYLEDMASGKLVPINGMTVGASQLVEAIKSFH